AWAAIRLIGICFLLINDALTVDGVKWLAAYKPGNHGLADNMYFFGLAVVFATQATGFDNFKFFRIFLSDIHKIAFVDSSRAMLKPFVVFAHDKLVGMQGHEAARHDDIAGENAFALDVVIVEGIGKHQGVGLF